MVREERKNSGKTTPWPASSGNSGKVYFLLIPDFSRLGGYPEISRKNLLPLIS